MNIPQHPALARTTRAIAAIGARQAGRDLPVIAHILAFVGLQLAVVAALWLG